MVRGEPQMNRNLSVALTLLCTVATFSVAAWAKNFRLAATSVDPSATGVVDTDTDKNGNTTVDLKAEHLAKPGMLTPPANAYVLWFEQQGADPESQGLLRVGDDLKAETKVTTPYHNFDIFITAESDPSTHTPSDQVLLRTKIQQ